MHTHTHAHPHARAHTHTQPRAHRDHANERCAAAIQRLHALSHPHTPAHKHTHTHTHTYKRTQAADLRDHIRAMASQRLPGMKSAGNVPVFRFHKDLVMELRRVPRAVMDKFYDLSTLPQPVQTMVTGAGATTHRTCVDCESLGLVRVPKSDVAALQLVKKPLGPKGAKTMMLVVEFCCVTHWKLR
jgi:hypothetical protein